MMSRFADSLQFIQHTLRLGVSSLLQRLLQKVRYGKDKELLNQVNQRLSSILYKALGIQKNVLPYLAYVENTIFRYRMVYAEIDKINHSNECVIFMVVRFDAVRDAFRLKKAVHMFQNITRNRLYKPPNGILYLRAHQSFIEHATEHHKTADSCP